MIESMKGKTFRPTPCQMFGKAAAEKVLDNTDPKDYDKVIYEMYVDAYWEPDEDDDLAEQRFNECFDLVFMLREAPKDLKIHYNAIKIKAKDLEFFSDVNYSGAKLEF